MNKAFTANINDQVTARGYLDENDQLIMLEPEMSGGGDLVDGVMVSAETVNDYYLKLDISCAQLIEYNESGKVVMFTVPADNLGDLVQGAKYGIVKAIDDSESSLVEVSLVIMQTETTNLLRETTCAYTALTDPALIDLGD